MADPLEHLAAVWKVAGSNPTQAKTVKLSLFTEWAPDNRWGRFRQLKERIGHHLSHAVAQDAIGL